MAKTIWSTVSKAVPETQRVKKAEAGDLVATLKRMPSDTIRSRLAGLRAKIDNLLAMDKRPCGYSGKGSDLNGKTAFILNIAALGFTVEFEDAPTETKPETKTEKLQAPAVR